MELELGLKITRTIDDLTSDLQIAKDRTGPFFLFNETETMFVLTGHLKGFKRERINIEINEDGTQIAISGEKAIQEMVMVRWIMYKKDVEIKRFRKVFRIPDGVVLDRIKANFNEEDSILLIFMPKLVKGVRGIKIEEVKEEEVDAEKMPIVADEVTKRDDIQEAIQPESKAPTIKTGEEGNQTGEASLESPEIESGEESEEITTPDTVEVPNTAIPDTGREMTKPVEVEPKRVINQSNTPDLLPSEDTPDEELPEIGEKTNKHENPEAETETPERESKGNRHDPEIAEPTKRIIHQSETPGTSPTQQIQDEETPQLATKEPEQAYTEQDRGPEIQEAAKLEPDQVLHPPETPARDQPANQQIGDHELRIEEEIYEEPTEVRENEVIEGEELSKEENKTEGESDLGFSGTEEEEEEEDNEESPKTESTRSVSERSTQTERPPSRKSLFFCPSLFAVSAFFASFLVLLFCLRRNKRR